MAQDQTGDIEWAAFAERLGACLGDLDVDDYLIVAYRHANYYVQCYQTDDGGVRAEAASNTYIEPPSAALSVEDYARMDGLGWGRATRRPPEEQAHGSAPGGSPNFFLDLAPPVDRTALARLAVRTLREVYQVRDLADLEYTAANKDGTQVRFPMLGIRRRG